MKKILLTLAFMVTTVVASAQFYVGGSFGFWDNDDAESTTYSIAPEVGYVFNEKLAAGFSITYESAEIKGDEISAFAFSPYARYTFAKIGSLSLFADGGLDIMSVDNGYESDTAWGIGIKPGLSVAISQKFSVLAHVGYLGYKNADEFASLIYEPGFGLSLSNNLSLSLYYSF